MSYETVGKLLEAKSDDKTAHSLGKQVQTLRGLRGVAPGEVAKIAAAAFAEHPPKLPEDGRSLSTLFSTAWEDGLVAIGLLSTTVPDSPVLALTLGLEWAGRTDDVATADALGWLVLGPAALAGGRDLVAATGPVRGLPDGVARRAAVAAGMAATPTPVEGPSAAPIRAKLGTPVVQWVEQLQLPVVRAVVEANRRDDSPPVRKALRRLIRAWGQADAASLQDWAAGVRGGIPTMLREEIEAAVRKANRPAKKR